MPTDRRIDAHVEIEHSGPTSTSNSQCNSDVTAPPASQRNSRHDAHEFQFKLELSHFDL
jgi:hypothetical protein